MAGDSQISSHSLPWCRCRLFPALAPWDALLPPCPGQLLPTLAPSLSLRQAGTPQGVQDTPAKSVFVFW